MWFAVFIDLRLLLGSAPSSYPAAALWIQNTSPESLARTAAALLFFLGPLVYMVPAGCRQAPDFVRLTAAMAPVHLVSYAVFGVWYETRLLMTLYPVFIPLVLAYLYGGASAETGPEPLPEECPDDL